MLFHSSGDSHKRPQKATGSHRRPQEAAVGHRRPWEAARGHRRPQEVARVHEKPQEARTHMSPQKVTGGVLCSTSVGWRVPPL